MYWHQSVGCCLGEILYNTTVKYFSIYWPSWYKYSAAFSFFFATSQSTVHHCEAVGTRSTREQKNRDCRGKVSVWHTAAVLYKIVMLACETSSSGNHCRVQYCLSWRFWIPTHTSSIAPTVVVHVWWLLSTSIFTKAPFVIVEYRACFWIAPVVHSCVTPCPISLFEIPKALTQVEPRHELRKHHSGTSSIHP